MFIKLKRNIKALGRKRFMFMFVIPLIVLFVAWITKIEPSRVTVQRLHLSQDEAHFTKPLRVLHISDLHLRRGVAVKRLQKALELALPSSPDIAVLTGDFEVPEKEQDYLMAQTCLQILSEAMPAYACLGNHDYLSKNVVRKDVVKLLTSSGVRLLRNESRSLIVNGQHLTVAGVEDYGQGTSDPSLCLEQSDHLPESPVLLLAHNPDVTTFQAFSLAWNITFSGHFHGGQIKLPFLDVRPMLYTATSHYCRPGLHPFARQRWVCESAGLGSTYELRFCCPPEITILEIK